VTAATAVAADSSENGGGADITKPKIHALLSKTPVVFFFVNKK